MNKQPTRAYWKRQIKSVDQGNAVVSAQFYPIFQAIADIESLR